MKKRAILGVSALLAVAVLPVANVFAADSALDYANSIGQIENGDTINRVVEATSDGGYIVGGQTVGCIKYELEIIKEDLYQEQDAEAKLAEKQLMPIDYVFATLQECEDYFAEQETGGTIARTKSGVSLVEEICGGMMAPKDYLSDANVREAEDEETEEVEPVYAYDYICMDYVAKFKQDGANEWLETINDNDEPFAVGETNSDYRMLTKSGSLYTFDKASGEEGIATRIDGPWFKAAKFDSDGSLYIIGDRALVKYGKNGQEVAALPNSSDGDTRFFANKIVMNGEIYVNRETYNSETDSYVEEIVKVSKDLGTVTPIITVPEGKNVYVVSSDDEGNFLTLECDALAETVLADALTKADDGEEKVDCCTIRSHDEDGEVLAEEADIERESISPDAFLDGYVIYDYEANTIAKMNKNLEPEFIYTLDDGEIVYNVTTLNDGSTVAVGYSTNSTANYEVAGAQNGIQLRLGSAKNTTDPTGDNPSNPSTLDNAHIFVISGAAILAGAAFFAKKMFGRR